MFGDNLGDYISLSNDGKILAIGVPTDNLILLIQTLIKHLKDT